MTKLPAWTQAPLFAILTTGFASFMVSGIATLRAIGLRTDFLANWISGWLYSWPVAAVAMYFVAPHVRRLLLSLCDLK
jgi:Protein of unknown function (DUF2798)